MKEKRRRKIRIDIFLLLLTLVFSGARSGEVVFADEGKARLSIMLEDLGTPIENVKFQIYKVGEWDYQSGSWKLLDSLQHTGIVLNNLTYASDWIDAALTLTKQPELETLVSVNGQTDTSGVLTFSDLDWGMYLVVQETESEYGTISPLLIPLPYIEDGVQKGEVTISPKAELPKEDKPESGEEKLPEDKPENGEEKLPEDKPESGEGKPPEDKPESEQENPLPEESKSGEQNPSQDETQNETQNQSQNKSNRQRKNDSQDAENDPSADITDNSDEQQTEDEMEGQVIAPPESTGENQVGDTTVTTDGNASEGAEQQTPVWEYAAKTIAAVSIPVAGGVLCWRGYKKPWKIKKKHHK